MKNLKISLKLSLSFGLVICALVISVIISIFNMQALRGKIEYYAGSAIPGIGHIWTARREMVSLDRSLYQATTSDDKKLTQTRIDAAQASIDAATVALNSFSAVYTGDESNIQKYFDIMAKTEPIKERIFKLLQNNENEEGVKILEEEFTPLFNEADALLDELAVEVNSRVNAYSEEAFKQATISVVLLIIVGVVSVMIAIVICAYITRSITKPVKEIQETAKKLADGDFDFKLAYESRDELGLLSDDIRKMASKLVTIIQDLGGGLGAVAAGDFTAKSKNDEAYTGEFIDLRNSMYALMTNLSSTLMEIDRSADQVSSGSDQVSSGSQALSQGTTEQASSIEELAATITEISHQVKETATNAEQARVRASNVTNEVEQSNARMNDMVQAMGDISNSSNEIGKIIKTIEDIAFQTNILALNAAVEAARAGAAGKGFAVVADEVRNLASKSAEASKSTAALIERSLHAVENGTNIADNTAKSLQTVVEGVKEVTQTVDKISDATNEQAHSITQVTIGVDQISSVVQTNSATAEESAAASEELSSQANVLKGLVGKFKLATNQSSATYEGSLSKDASVMTDYAKTNDKY